MEDIWPLSPLQEGVYFQARYAQAAVYIVQNVFDFVDPVDVDALRTAYSAVMRRNPVLRSGFWADDLPQPVAAIVADPVCEPELIDLTDLAPDQISERVDEITADDRLRTFDLAAPPLARMTVHPHRWTRPAGLQLPLPAARRLVPRATAAGAVRRVHRRQARHAPRTCPSRPPTSPTTCGGWPARTGTRPPGSGPRPSPT